MERWEIRTSHTDIYTNDGEHRVVIDNYIAVVDPYASPTDWTRVCALSRVDPVNPTEGEYRRARLMEAAPELLEALISRGTHDGECRASQDVHSDACLRDADLLRRLEAR